MRRRATVDYGQDLRPEETAVLRGSAGSDTELEKEPQCCHAVRVFELRVNLKL